jgi:hypothetical protein
MKEYRLMVADHGRSLWRVGTDWTSFERRVHGGWVPDAPSEREWETLRSPDANGVHGKVTEDLPDDYVQQVLAANERRS